MSEKEKEDSREEDESIWLVPALLMTFILVGGGIYTIYLESIGVIPSDYFLVLYGFLLLFPVSMAICFGTYEIFSSLRINKPFLFHLKRFLFRTIVFLGCGIFIAAFFSLLSPLLSWRYAILFSCFLMSLTLAILVANPKIRHLLKKFGEIDAKLKNAGLVKT